jgi:hypothetical protein
VARGIPYRRLTQGSMVQFGWGSKQRRIQAAETDLTSAVAESIAQDKDSPRPCCTPPACRCRWAARSRAEDAWAAAQEINGPVVVKPRDGNQGKGVAVRIRTREEVMTAKWPPRFPRRAGRALHPRPRLPPARGRQAPGGRRPPRSAAGDRRRRAPCASWSTK